MERSNTIQVVREYCTRSGHGYGSHIEGPFGLECVACLRVAEDLPEDYEPCGDCGFDHGYEQAESIQAHERLDAEVKPTR